MAWHNFLASEYREARVEDVIRDTPVAAKVKATGIGLYVIRNAVAAPNALDSMNVRSHGSQRISQEQALRSVNNPDELELKLQGIEHGFA